MSPYDSPLRIPDSLRSTASASSLPTADSIHSPEPPYVPLQYGKSPIDSIRLILRHSLAPPPKSSGLSHHNFSVISTPASALCPSLAAIIKQSRIAELSTPLTSNIVSLLRSLHTREPFTLLNREERVLSSKKESKTSWRYEHSLRIRMSE